MDQDDIELIARLCTKIGSIMEDASVVAITTSGRCPGRIGATLTELKATSNSIAARVGAAAAVADSTD